ncbi:hypothetical protein [Mucilaginibacter sp.]
METLKKSSNATRKASRKRTTGSFAVARAANGRFVAVSYTSEVKGSSLGRFNSMFENIEKFEPVIIPGYKVRG